MKFRVLAVLVLTLAALSVGETASAASTRTLSPSAQRREERLRLRLARRTAVEERRAARLRARTAPSRSPYAALTDRVFKLTNDAREDEGLKALSRNAILDRTAQAYAEDMATRGFFAHEDPDGRSSGERILEGGYAKPSCLCSWKYGTGENLAQGQDTPEEAVEDWLASPGHRANILRRDFEDIGIGYFDGHWVQHFGVSKTLP